MKIEIQHIPAHGLHLVQQIEPRRFPTLKSLMESGEVDFTQPLSFDLKVRAESDLIIVKGLLQTRLKLTCSRCLEAFESPVSQRFTLRFSRDIPQDIHHANPEEIELTAEQVGLTFFQGEEIDLRDHLQEQVVLALPFAPVCRQECKGLCVHCGADLNSEACGCREDESASPFSVLKKLKLPKS